MKTQNKRKETQSNKADNREEWRKRKISIRTSYRDVLIYKRGKAESL
jgi:hypothetical protein